MGESAGKKFFSFFQALLNYEEIQENINVSDRYDNDPLHIAAMKGYLPIVRVSSFNYVY